MKTELTEIAQTSIIFHFSSEPCILGIKEVMLSTIWYWPIIWDGEHQMSLHNFPDLYMRTKTHTGYIK